MTEYMRADGTVQEGPDPIERKVVWAIGTLLLVSTILFTVLHHGFPTVFNVPPREYFDKKLPPHSFLLKNFPEASMANFRVDSPVLAVAPGSCLLTASGSCGEVITDRGSYIAEVYRDLEALEGEAIELPEGSVLRVPIPGSGHLTMFLLDLIPIALAWLCFHHGWRRLGPYRAMLFLGGSFVFTGLEESMWILLGRFQEQLRALGGTDLQNAVLTEGAADVSGTYYFTKGFFWFLETPLLACLGWFFVAYSCVYVADVLFPKRSIWLRSAVGGFLAVNLDLWLDPVQTSNAFLSWIWAKGDRIEIFSIPLSNFLGWFLLIFLFAIVFDRVPAMIKKWGPVKTSIYFYAILFALEIGILLFFITYGSIAMRLLPETINFTVRDIGRYSLTF